MIPASVHREFVADLAGAAALDDWLETATEGWPCPSLVMKARVCVAEIASNLIEHGGEPGRIPRLSVTLSMEDGGGVALDLTDDGRAFDPTRTPAAPAGETLATATAGGRGLRTIRGLARALAYRREDGRNHLSVKIGP